MSKDSNTSILTKTLKTASGHKIGILTLNAPHAMNAVDLAMVQSIDQTLQTWQNDNSVVAVFMHGAGDKAFSAGGDIRQLYDSMNAEGDEHLRYGDAFFEGEYSKNFHVHCFNKPLIAWGHGFVMGGGLGLYIAANHRVGSETLKLAWPEIRIGLFPDVGATWWLSRLPKPVGHWMALSGSHMNATDCQQLGLTHYSLKHDQQQAVIKQLKQLPWGKNLATNHLLVRRLLQQQQSSEPLVESELSNAKSTLERFFKSEHLVDIDKAFRAYKGNNPWIQQGIKNYVSGCPATAHIIMRQLENGQNLSLKEVVKWELDLAYQSLRHPDFAEGIRAMVIDKDYSPKWQHADVHSVPKEWVDKMCKFPWKDEHPFTDLAPF